MLREKWCCTFPIMVKKCTHPLDLDCWLKHLKRASLNQPIKLLKSTFSSQAANDRACNYKLYFDNKCKSIDVLSRQLPFCFCKQISFCSFVGTRL